MADLAEDGYVTLTHLISARLPRVHVVEDLFLTFDPHCLGHDPVADARILIPLVLSKESVSLPELHAESGLGLRRFNPAIGLLIAEVGEGRVSGSWLEGYHTPYFLIADEDRVAIKRLARRLAGQELGVFGIRDFEVNHRSSLSPDCPHGHCAATIASILHATRKRGGASARVISLLLAASRLPAPLSCTASFQWTFTGTQL